MNIEQVAELCYELNRVYCRQLGDTSFLPWKMAPDWQKNTNIAGVKFHLANPNATPESSHESWLLQKQNEGWKYGPVKNPELKEHPCFVPYNDLPQDQQIKDYLFRGTVHSLLPFVKE